MTATTSASSLWHSLISAPFGDVQDNPPVARNQAPVSGAIKWSRSLFARCKRTYVVLNAVEPGLRHEPAGKQARLSRRMRTACLCAISHHVSVMSEVSLG